VILRMKPACASIALLIEKVLAGSKTWEIRGRRASIRGRIALIRSRSGFIVGTCELVDVVGPLTLKEYRRSARKWEPAKAANA
jgi:hypothetical protein